MDEVVTEFLAESSRKLNELLIRIEGLKEDIRTLDLQFRNNRKRHLKQYVKSDS
jgi:hypothetical protein